MKINGDRVNRMLIHQIPLTKKIIERYKEETNKNGPFRRVGTPCFEATDMPARELDDKEGERKRTAAKHTGGLQYLTRGAREDAAYGTGCLSRHTTKWTMLDDKNLERIMAYLESTLDTGTLLE